MRAARALALGVLALGHPAPPAAPPETFDVVVYGGTSAGVVAAVQARRMGASVVLVSPRRHLGGMSSNGLGWTDSGDKRVIGGLSREFYRRVKRHYDRPEAWTREKAEDFGRYDPGAEAIWVFEPHVAEAVFEELLADAGVPVHRDAWLDREHGVARDGSRIVSITTRGGETFAGRVFVDATYEGDLLAAAGVSYRVGREGNGEYGESLNGVQTRNAVHHQFEHPVSPFVDPDDPASGLLPGVHGGGPGAEGSGDARVQAYCFRLCLTDDPDNRLPFPRPEGYDPLRYELLLRDLLAGSRHVFGKFDRIPERKTDTNNHGSFSTDDIGASDAYPEASDTERRAIVQEHQRYEQGYFWFLCHDPRVPAEVRERMSRWGLAADEFQDAGGWPHELYVREARRMLGTFVMTERTLRGLDPTPEPVGMGSYNLDSHNVQRYVAHDEDGKAVVRNEGDVEVSPGRAYPIARGALLPRREECTNLVVPVAVSATHIAFGSIRMEPVFMILGQSAATLAVLAVRQDVAVQAVPYPALRAHLLADGQVLEGPSRK